MKPLKNDFNIINVVYMIHKNEKKRDIVNFYEKFNRLPDSLCQEHLQKFVDFYTMRGIDCEIITNDYDDTIKGLSVKSKSGVFSYTVSNMESIPFMIKVEQDFRKIK